MESIQDNLTNEKLKSKFTSQFDLVSYAIKLAENMIKTGRGPRVKTDVQNVAMQICEEIRQGKDRLDLIVDEPESNAPVHETYSTKREKLAEKASSKQKVRAL